MTDSSFKELRKKARDILDNSEIFDTVRSQTAAIEALSEENAELDRAVAELKRSLDALEIRFHERMEALEKVLNERMAAHKESVIATAERTAAEAVARFVDSANKNLLDLALKVDRIERQDTRLALSKTSGQHIDGPCVDDLDA